MISKKYLLFGVVTVLLLGGSLAVSAALLKPQTIETVTVAAEQRHLQEVVHADGKIVPAQNVDLSFERAGRIAHVYKNVGDTVKAGEVLLELEHGTESTMIAQARAYLVQKQAGFSATEIDIYRAATDAANADLEKTKTDTQATITAAQSMVETAQNNLKLASGGDQSQIVGQAYETAVTTLQMELSQIDTGLNQADDVLGIDHVSRVAHLRLSALDESKLALATNRYAIAKSHAQRTRALVEPLGALASHETIDTVIIDEQAMITELVQLLNATSDVLKATPSGSVTDQSLLSTMQTAVQQTRTGLTAQSTQLVTTKQALENAKNSLNAFTIAFTKAQHDLTNTQASAASLVRLKDAGYQQALANLASKTQPVRETDLAPLRASLYAASVAYDKTLLKSPIDGVIGKQDGIVGAIISPNLPILSVMNAQSFQLEVFVPEMDLAKIQLGNGATITTDAYGADVLFSATVVKIDPTVTTKNGDTGYKVTLQFTKQDDRIKTGMIGNATIISQEKDASVALPERSILQKNGTFEVLLQTTGGKTAEQVVAVGLRSSDGWREILSGLKAGDRVQDFGN